MCIEPLLKIVPNKFIIFPLIEVGGLLKKNGCTQRFIEHFKKKNGNSVFVTFSRMLASFIVAAHDGAIAAFGRAEVFFF